MSIFQQILFHVDAFHNAFGQTACFADLFLGGRDNQKAFGNFDLLATVVHGLALGTRRSTFAVNRSFATHGFGFGIVSTFDHDTLVQLCGVRVRVRVRVLFWWIRMGCCVKQKKMGIGNYISFFDLERAGIERVLITGKF